MDISGFGGNFAASTATEIVKRGVSVLRDTALGDEESRALTHRLAAALEGALSQIQPRGPQIPAAGPPR